MRPWPSKSSPSRTSKASIADNLKKMSQFQTTDTKLFNPSPSRESRKYNIERHIKEEANDTASKSTNGKLIEEYGMLIEQPFMTKLPDKSTWPSKKRHSTVLRNLPYKRRRMTQSKQNNQKEIRKSSHLITRNSRRKIKSKSKGKIKKSKRSNPKNTQGSKKSIIQQSTSKIPSRSNIRKKHSGKKLSKVSSPETFDIKKITPARFKLIPLKSKNPLFPPQRVSIYSSSFNRANQTIKNITRIEQTKSQKPQDQPNTSLLNCDIPNVRIENFHRNEFHTELQSDVQETILPESGDSILASWLDQNGKIEISECESKILHKKNSTACFVSDYNNNKKMKKGKTQNTRSQVQCFEPTSFRNMEKIDEMKCGNILNETQVLNNIQLPVCENNINKTLSDESTSINIVPNKSMKSNFLPALQQNNMQFEPMKNTLSRRNKSENFLKNCYKQRENTKILIAPDINCNVAEGSDSEIVQSCSSKSVKKIDDKADVYKSIRKSIQKPFLVIPNFSCLNWLKYVLKATDGINRI